jgi:hypothetical protein
MVALPAALWPGLSNSMRSLKARTWLIEGVPSLKKDEKKEPATPAPAK